MTPLRLLRGYGDRRQEASRPSKTVIGLPKKRKVINKKTKTDHGWPGNRSSGRYVSNIEPNPKFNRQPLTKRIQIKADNESCSDFNWQKIYQFKKIIYNERF